MASAHQNSQGEDINAVAAKVGSDSSAVQSSHDFKLSGVTGADKAVSKTGEETLSTKTLTTPIIATLYQDAGKTKLMIVPNTASDTLAALAASQTLTNKTLTSPLFQGSIDGWTDALETWEWNDATHITVPSGAASKYQKGDKIKLTQTTVKYFSVVGVADTVLTITGGSDYTLANAAISLNYYSKVENPQGFPHWFEFTPVYTCSSSMTYTSVTTQLAKFRITGQSCIVVIRANGTTGGSASSTIYATIPVTINASNTYLVVGAGTEGGVLGGVMFNQDANTFGFRKYDNSNWTLATNMRIAGQMEYPI